jgi:hypothetical protein
VPGKQGLQLQITKCAWETGLTATLCSFFFLINIKAYSSGFPCCIIFKKKKNRGNHTIAPSYFDSPKSVLHFTLKVGFPTRPESEDLALRYRDT